MVLGRASKLTRATVFRWRRSGSSDRCEREGVGRITLLVQSSDSVVEYRSQKNADGVWNPLRPLVVLRFENDLAMRVAAFELLVSIANVVEGIDRGDRDFEATRGH